MPVDATGHGDELCRQERDARERVGLNEPTPTPWQVVRYAVSSYHIVAEGDAGPIASVPTDHPDAAANARLISMAPDLLAACRYLCAEIHNGSDSEAFMRGIAEAEAIIAKAEGKS